VWLPLELLQERYNYFSMCCIHLYKWQPHADSEDDDENPTVSAVCFLDPVYSKVHSQVFLWTARQYHSIYMLGLGFVASLHGHYLGRDGWY